ncbi:MAG: 50S ribosomal protein L17 [Bacteroidota bacterium]|nr:50S ribosomal protein L17 [Bacteroidota bacterium]
MRHGNKNNNLKRTKAHRESMLSNMACSLIMHKRINTTLAKAKVLRSFIEPLITRSKPVTTKVEDTHNRRVVFSYLADKYAVAELFKEIGPKVADRPGGYTRIIRYSISVKPGVNAKRRMDNADMAMIELVDYNELMLNIKGEAKKAKTTRRGRAKTKKAEGTDTTETQTEEKGE